MKLPQKRLVKEQIIRTDSQAPTTVLMSNSTKCSLVADWNYIYVGEKV